MDAHAYEPNEHDESEADENLEEKIMGSSKFNSIDITHNKTIVTDSDAQSIAVKKCLKTLDEIFCTSIVTHSLIVKTLQYHYEQFAEIIE
jgi:hypothetical protein